MAFPVLPIVGELHTNTQGTIWEWNGTTWIKAYSPDSFLSPGSGGSTLDPSDREFIPLLTAGDGSTTGKAISMAPAGDIVLFINSAQELIGDGVLTKAAYFSDDGGATAKTIASVGIGDVLFWNGVIATYDLNGVSDVGRLVYEV